MLYSLAVANYRSLRDLIIPLDRINLITGANGSGKSNLYRGLRLLAETSQGTATSSIASEGGLFKLLWAGPEEFGRSVRQGVHPVQGKGKRKSPINLRLGFAGEDFSYAIDFGIPEPLGIPTMFTKDPEIKREVIWYGGTWHHRRAMVDRRGPLVRARDESGGWQIIEQHLPSGESMLTQLPDPVRAPEALHLSRQVNSWRFYDHFRTDMDSPARQSQVGSRSPVLSSDGRDLASAWQTIREIGDNEGLDHAVTDAFPGAHVEVVDNNGRFELQFHQHGLLRPLSQAELSDGTLRYLLWIAALLTPRPPTLMVLNEPETSLHPELLPALGRLMRKCAESTQLWVVSHAPLLIRSLADDCNHVRLTKELGETQVADRDEFDLDVPAWKWPSR